MYQPTNRLRRLNRRYRKALKGNRFKNPNFLYASKGSQTQQSGKASRIFCYNSHTEKLSAYVDEFLRPLAEKLPSHIKDTTDFIKRLCELGKVPENCILVTLDISSLYTNIDTNEGLIIVEEEFEKASWKYPSAKTLACLLEKVLKLNNFTFNQEHFIQVKGTTMGYQSGSQFRERIYGPTGRHLFLPDRLV